MKNKNLWERLCRFFGRGEPTIDFPEDKPATLDQSGMYILLPVLVRGKVWACRITFEFMRKETSCQRHDLMVEAFQANRKRLEGVIRLCIKKDVALGKKESEIGPDE